MATLINGNGNLAIYAQQDADWYAALMGGQTVITAVGNQFAYELLASNTIGVKDGVIITSEGRRIQLMQMQLILSTFQQELRERLTTTS